jgi:methionine sulfoxide reductase heme-binding subunit
MSSHLFWIASRAAGSLALVLASVSVAVGLLQARRRLSLPAAEVRAVHEALSLATIAAIVFHGGLLLGDGFINAGLADVTVPFAGSYQRLWTTTGILSGWALILLGLGYYVRGRIGAARWRKLHRFTALAWLAGLAHSLGEGTDAGTAWFLVGTTIVVLPTLALLLTRTFQPRPREVTS